MNHLKCMPDLSGLYRRIASHTASHFNLYRRYVKALDVLTPVGRGQCMLLTGEVGTSLSQLGLSSITAQAGTGGAVQAEMQLIHSL
jgi:hypothetical protein